MAKHTLNVTFYPGIPNMILAQRWGVFYHAPGKYSLQMSSGMTKKAAIRRALRNMRKAAPKTISFIEEVDDGEPQ